MQNNLATRANFFPHKAQIFGFHLEQFCLRNIRAPDFSHTKLIKIKNMVATDFLEERFMTFLDKGFIDEKHARDNLLFS